MQSDQGPSEKGANINRRMLIGGIVLAAAAAPGMPAMAATPSNASGCNETGTVWWNELISPDPEKVRTFYAKVIGWTPRVVARDDNSRAPKPGEPTYTLFLVNGSEIAGLAKIDAGEGSTETGWLSYIEVDNVDTAVLAAANNGGKVVSPPSTVPGVGRIAVVEDPQGAAFGLVTPLRSSGC